MSAQTKPDQSAVVDEVRSAVRALVLAGADQKTICYSLALVSAELGLQVTQKPLAVLPVVMNAFMSAASQYAVAESDAAPQAMRPPPCSRLH